MTYHRLSLPVPSKGERQAGLSQARSSTGSEAAGSYKRAPQCNGSDARIWAEAEALDWTCARRAAGREVP
jgi:hypothetical protein